MDAHDLAPYRLFNNPIYGSNENGIEIVYADPDTNMDQAGTRNDLRSSHYHKFDSPIYGGETENAHSMLSSFSTVQNSTASCH